MGAYNRFSEVYDLFMSEIPYEKWADHIQKVLSSYGITEGLVAELGCGTGTMCELLQARGYDMTGIDNSEEMLDQALKKRDKSGASILYLLQDIREFELYGTMAAIVSVCDTMNYLTEREDFVETLKLVNNYLDPNGIFIFDVKTAHYYRDVLGNRSFSACEEEACYIWENEYDEEYCENAYYLTVFTDRGDGLYERSEEEHLQRAYSVSELKEMAEEAGMEFLMVQDAATGEAVCGENASEEVDRLYIILREKGKA